MNAFLQKNGTHLPLVVFGASFLAFLAFQSWPAAAVAIVALGVWGDLRRNFGEEVDELRARALRLEDATKDLDKMRNELNQIKMRGGVIR